MPTPAALTDDELIEQSLMYRVEQSSLSTDRLNVSLGSLRALVRASRAQAAVPREPTEAMIKAVEHWFVGRAALSGNAWRAMWDAYQRDAAPPGAEGEREQTPQELTDAECDAIFHADGWDGWPGNFNTLQAGLMRDSCRVGYAAAMQNLSRADGVRTKTPDAVTGTTPIAAPKAEEPVAWQSLTHEGMFSQYQPTAREIGHFRPLYLHPPTDKVRAALVRLEANVSGPMQVWESQMRDVMGNTNFEVIQRCLEAAREALKP